MPISDALPFTFEDAISKADETRHPALLQFIGDCLFYGNNELNVNKLNKHLAFKYYKESARQKHIGGIQALANCYWTGEGTRCNPLKAIRLLTQAVDTTNDLETIKKLASWHWQLDTIPSNLISGSSENIHPSVVQDDDSDQEDELEYDDLAEDDEEEGTNKSSIIAPMHYVKSPLHPNKKYGPIASLKLLLKAAKMGDIQSTHKAASILLNGYNDSILPNPRKAEELLEYAAVALGDSEATIKLARYHYAQVLSPTIKKEPKQPGIIPTKNRRSTIGHSRGGKKLGIPRHVNKRNILQPPCSPSSRKHATQRQARTPQQRSHIQERPCLEKSLSALSQSSQELVAQSQLLSLTPLNPLPVADSHLLYVIAIDKAKEYLEKAASLGDSPSLVLLGDLYRDCKIPIKDEEGSLVNPKVKALGYYIAASAKQDVRGMMCAAQMLCLGDGVDVDLRRAFHFLHRASKISSTPRLKDLAEFVSAHPLLPLKPLPSSLSQPTTPDELMNEGEETEEVTPYQLYLSSLEIEHDLSCLLPLSKCLMMGILGAPLNIELGIEYLERAILDSGDGDLKLQARSLLEAAVREGVVKMKEPRLRILGVAAGGRDDCDWLADVDVKVEDEALDSVVIKLEQDGDGPVSANTLHV